MGFFESVIFLLPFLQSSDGEEDGDLRYIFAHWTQIVATGLSGASVSKFIRSSVPSIVFVLRQ